MLTQHSKIVARNIKRVKTMAAVAIVAALSSMPAQAIEFQDTVYKITIKKDELTTETGIENVYDRFQHKARKACRSAGPYPTGYRTPKSDCISDLIDQFVTSAQVPELAAYHRRMLTQPM